MSPWIDGVLLSAVDSSLLADSVTVNSLSKHEPECKEFTKLFGVFSPRNESLSDAFLLTKTFSLTTSFNFRSIETFSMLQSSVLDR